MIVLAAIIGLASCSSRSGGVPDAAPSAAGIAAPGQKRLGHASNSVEGLMNEALAAYAAGDTAALRGLLITKEEFDAYLYPEFGVHYPAARDTSAQARDFIWENHALTADKALRRSLRELGGRRMDLIAVSFGEAAKTFPSYILHEGTEVKVRLEDGGEADLLAFGSIVEMDGVYKLLSYRDRK